MTAVSFPKGNMKRQAMEAQCITEQGEKAVALNRRGEWGQNLPPSLEVDDKKAPRGKKRGRKSPEQPQASPPPASAKKKCRESPKPSLDEPSNPRNSCNPDDTTRTMMMNLLHLQ